MKRKKTAAGLGHVTQEVWQASGMSDCHESPSQRSTRKNAVVSLAELKRIAKRLMPADSMLRKLILSEPDIIPREKAIVKIEMYSRMLCEELG